MLLILDKFPILLPINLSMLFASNFSGTEQSNMVNINFVVMFGGFHIEMNVLNVLGTACTFATNMSCFQQLSLKLRNKLLYHTVLCILA